MSGYTFAHMPTLAMPCGAQAYAKIRRHGGGGLLPHPPDHFLSTFHRQFGILVAVHLLPRSVSVCLLTPAYRFVGG